MAWYDRRLLKVPEDFEVDTRSLEYKPKTGIELSGWCEPVNPKHEIPREEGKETGSQ